MSLLSSIILPKLEAELVALEPEIAAFLIKQLHFVAKDVLAWAEGKLHIDLNGDGKIQG